MVVHLLQHSTPVYFDSTTILYLYSTRVVLVHIYSTTYIFICYEHYNYVQRPKYLRATNAIF